MSSSVSARTESGWHVLKIEGYSQIKGILGVGKYVKSGKFEVGGHSWCIRCFPDGYDKDNADWLCVDLSINDPAPSGDVKVRFDLSLLDQVGEPVSDTIMRSNCTSFSSANKSWGYFHFIKRTALESLYLNGDSFKIRCNVTVVKEIRTETTMESLAVPSSDLHCHLKTLLDTKVGCDVTVQVGGEEFTAHRVVLAARSPVFMAELYGPMKEKDASCVQIHDMEARVFKVLLYFIYTDSLPEIDEGDQVIIAQHLLVAADKYAMERLKLICADTLRERLDSSSVATTLVLAEQHCCHGLKEACFKFLKFPGNLTAAMASDGFLHLKRSCPSLLEELLAKIAP